ncbi:hypothetical protein QVD17_24417 [Tagetes erecta]|uniref:Uncharacterized protein n=1 Tax=Tagetes erecta TaxID=13708 RepID=A0AAD8NV13_TARER|nr:hypothetical protein QVD17_24417 [Tagetes erecta]
MPSVLAEWHYIDGTPSTFKVGESSHSHASFPLTGEPVEVTVPALVAQCHSYDQRVRSLDQELDKLAARQHADRELIESLHARLAMTEQFSVAQQQHIHQPDLIIQEWAEEMHEYTSVFGQ